MVAERLRAIVRPADTAARLGGDEFAVLVEDVVGEAEASYIAERILGALSVPFSLHGNEVTVGASIGIALNVPGISIDQLMKNADAAMYSAKSSGRGRCQTYADRSPSPKAEPSNKLATPEQANPAGSDLPT